MLQVQKNGNIRNATQVISQLIPSQGIHSSSIFMWLATEIENIARASACRFSLPLPHTLTLQKFWLSVNQCTFHLKV